jgi:hypothetical protein
MGQYLGLANNYQNQAHQQSLNRYNAEQQYMMPLMSQLLGGGLF